MRAWSYRFSVALYESLFTGPDWPARRAYARFPYAWIYLLIPIAGLVGFYGVVWEYNMERRERNLATRRLALGKRRAALRDRP